MRKGLVCPVLCKLTSSGLNPQSEVRQPHTHLFSPAFIYLLSFFDSAVSLSLHLCVCISLSPFLLWLCMNNSKWLGNFTLRLSYHLCFSAGIFSPYPLLFSTPASSGGGGGIQSSLFPDPLISFQATSVICESVHDEQCFTFSSV